MICYTLKKIAQITDGEVIGNEKAQIKGVEYDSRLFREGILFAPIIGERVDGHRFVSELFDRGISGSLWQKNTTVPMPKGNLVLVDDVVCALQKLAKVYRSETNCRVIAVTGSSGKTSTKDIVAAALSAKFRTYKTQGNQNNEIGVPMTLLNLDDEAQYAIVECGISDFGEMDLLADIVRPDMTIIASIGPAHIAQFRHLDNTAQEKCKINLYLGDGQAFYNFAAYGLQKELTTMNLIHKPISYGIACGDVQAEDIAASEEYTTFKCNEVLFRIPLLGKHQVLNSVGAIAIAHHEGVSDEEIQRGFDAVQLTPHRLQILKMKDAIIIDDTYNANPASMVASLQTMEEYNPSYTKTVVLGDMLELGENSLALHASIADEIDFKRFSRIILVGEQIKALQRRLNDMCIECEHYDTIDNVSFLLKESLTKNNVLFFKASNGMNFLSIIEQLKEN